MGRVKLAETLDEIRLEPQRALRSCRQRKKRCIEGATILDGRCIDASEFHIVISGGESAN